MDHPVSENRRAPEEEASRSGSFCAMVRREYRPPPSSGQTSIACVDQGLGVRKAPQNRRGAFARVEVCTSQARGSKEFLAPKFGNWAWRGEARAQLGKMQSPEGGRPLGAALQTQRPRSSFYSLASAAPAGFNPRDEIGRARPFHRRPSRSLSVSRLFASNLAPIQHSRLGIMNAFRDVKPLRRLNP